MDGQLYQFVIDNLTRLLRCPNAVVHQQRFETFAVQYSPCFRDFCPDAVGQNPFAKLFERKVTVPRTVPYSKSLVNILNQIICRQCLYIPVQHRIFLQIFCLLPEGSIYTRYIIFFLLDLVYRIYKVIILLNASSRQVSLIVRYPLSAMLSRRNWAARSFSESLLSS